MRFGVWAVNTLVRQMLLNYQTSKLIQIQLCKMIPRISRLLSINLFSEILVIREVPVPIDQVVAVTGQSSLTLSFADECSDTIIL